MYPNLLSELQQMLSFTSDVIYKSSHWLAQRISDKTEQHYSLDHCISFEQLNTLSVSKGNEEFKADHTENEQYLRFILKKLDIYYVHITFNQVAVWLFRNIQTTLNMF